MSTSERERQTLESIENGLVRSAPKLASMLGIFTRLAAYASEACPPPDPARPPLAWHDCGNINPLELTLRQSYVPDGT